VLLAEDSPVNALVIAKQLDTLGFACTIAENGEQAWAALQAGTPFVALLTDCDMPVLDGYSLAQRVRADAGLARLPIIALSARPDAAQQARCRAAGMDDCLPKPVSNAALAGALSARAVVAGDGDEAVDDLDALKRVFPDPRALSDLFAQFVQCARVDLDALERAHAAGTIVAFAKLLHRFAGSLQMLNQRELADELEWWRRTGRLPTSAEYTQLRGQLVSVIERVRSRIDPAAGPR
jgi:two-component system sensor histidine kinase EvgS